MRAAGVLAGVNSAADVQYLALYKPWRVSLTGIASSASNTIELARVYGFPPGTAFSEAVRSSAVGSLDVDITFTPGEGVGAGCMSTNTCAHARTRARACSVVPA